MRTDIEADSRNSYEKFYRVSAYFFKNIRWIILKKPHKRKLMRKGSTEGEALCARVQGVQLPCAGQGRQPLPREVMPASLHTGYCLTLKSAGLAAKLPFSQAALMGENERKCFVPCVQEDKRFPSEGNSKEGRKMTIG